MKNKVKKIKNEIVKFATLMTTLGIAILTLSRQLYGFDYNQNTNRLNKNTKQQCYGYIISYNDV